MALDFVCGWECRCLNGGPIQAPDEKHWDNTSTDAGISISTTTVRSGTAALRCNSTAAVTDIFKTIARTVVAGRCYVRFASFAANSGFIRCVNANGNGTIITDASGNITAAVGAGTPTGTIITASTGVWYRFDWLYDSSGGTTTLKVRVDGGTEFTASNVQASANATQVRVGNFAATTMDLFFDDLLLGTATGDYPFGEGTVERMKPTRDGTHSFTALDFEYNDVTPILTSATDVNTYVDDDVLTGITDFISQNVVRTTGYVEVGFGAAPFSHDPLAVMVVSSWHASTTGANQIGLKMNDGGTLANMTDAAGDGLSDFSGVTAHVHEKLSLTAPTGGDWTKAKLDAVLMRMGYSGDVVGIPYWDGVMLEVAYAPAPIVTFVPYRNPMPPLIAQ